MSWVIPQGCHSLLSESLAAFGGGKKARVLWGCCRRVILRIFDNK